MDRGRVGIREISMGTSEETSKPMLRVEADRIEASIAAGTLGDMPEFQNVHPDSRAAVAKTAVAAYREQLRRDGRL
jgi:hypothetical protein